MIRFPANHVEEIRTDTEEKDGAGASCSLSESGDASAQPLGILQKGSYDIVGVTVEYKQNSRGMAGNDMEHILRMAHPITLQEFEVAAETKEEALTVCCSMFFSSMMLKEAVFVAVGICDQGHRPVCLRQRGPKPQEGASHADSTRIVQSRHLLQVNIRRIM